MGNALEDDGQFGPETVPEERETMLEEENAVPQGQDNAPEEEHESVDKPYLEARSEEERLQQEVKQVDQRPRENEQVEQDFVPEDERWLTDDPWLQPRREDKNLQGWDRSSQKPRGDSSSAWEKDKWRKSE
ncbi:hypothetical protein BC567DRAFT_223140 [Phyllosticta citribraziliensis]